MHEIGKDIAVTMLKAAGFDVHDLGRDVSSLDFVRRAEEVHADIIGASALMTTTMPAQKEIVDILVAKGLRTKYHVIIGGAPVTAEWVAEAGADSWGEDAGKAVKILEQVHGREGRSRRVDDMPHLKMWEIMERAAEGPFCEDDDLPLRGLPAQDEAGPAQVRDQVRPGCTRAGRRRPRRPRLAGRSRVLSRRSACTTSTRIGAS